jgi:hypothetical protein
VADVALPAHQPGHLGRIDIEAEDWESFAGKTTSQGQSHVTQADDADLRLMFADAIK